MDRQMQCGLRGFYERRADRLREGLLTEEDIVEQCRKRRAIRVTESRLDALDDDSGEEQEDNEAEPTTVGVLIIKDGNVLAGVRKSDFCPFTICGPGGHIEAGETPEEAAVRETQEEFGVTPTELVPIGMQTEQEEKFGRNMLYLCTEYEGQISTDNVEMVAPHWLDYGEAVEAAKNENEALFPPFARSLIVLDRELEKISEENGENFIDSPEDKRYNDSCNEDWDDELHPRDKEGRFTNSGGITAPKVNGPAGSKEYIKGYFAEHPEVEKEAEKYMGVMENVINFKKDHPDAEEGTYDAVTGEDIKKEDLDGYCVTFHQNFSEDDPFGAYDSQTYAAMCAIAMNELGSKSVNIGYFGGSPEVSFVCKDQTKVVDFAITHNQHSVFDPSEGEDGRPVKNAYYNRETNPIKGY